MGRNCGEELLGEEGEEALIRIYCMRKEFIHNKRKQTKVKIRESYAKSQILESRRKRLQFDGQLSWRQENLKIENGISDIMQKEAETPTNL